MKGVFITFEGPDGAGKSTQIRKFAAYLEAHGHQVQLTREPGGTPLGDRVRKVVLDPAAGVVDDRTETLLYLASRAQHVAELIVPALSAGKVVVCDRFSDSTLAYQGIARGLGLEKMSQLNEFATGGLQPDLTFLLDGNPAELAGRRSRRRFVDRMELEKDGFQEKVREGFLLLAQKYPERIHKIQAMGHVDRIQQQIVTLFEEFLQKKSE
ncbi:MAG: dTMP kinase [Negativicutes bacterium]|nr:dTMP kinase [Negativicutes bacterium]